MRIALCNCPPEHASPPAQMVVQKRLAACVNIISNVRSVYLWEGQMHDETEATLIIKVAADQVDALRGALVAAHPYELPEVLVIGVDLDASHQPYVDWVRCAHRL